MRILLIEDNPGDARLIQEILREGGGDFTISVAERLGAGLEFLASKDVDVVLLDLNLPDSIGLETFSALQTRFSHLPVVIITSIDDETLAHQAVRLGAQDYLVKGKLNGQILRHILLYAIERKQMAEELHQRVLAHSPAVLYNFKIEGQDLVPVFVSENVERLLGFNVAEAAHYGWWLENVHPDDRDRVLAVVGEGIKGKGYKTEYRIRDKNGDYHWIEDNNSVVRDDAGLHIQAVGVWTDITDRKLSEEKVIASETRYRRLFESAKDGILILDAGTGIVVDVNPFLARLLGYPSEKIIGKYVWEPGILKDVIASKYRFMELQQKGYVRYEDLPLTTADGRKVEVEFISNVYLVNQQKVIQCNIRDITERKSLEAQLRHSQKMEAVGTLAGGIAHDFNNILNVIMGFGSMVRDNLEADSPSRENINEVLIAADRAANLTKRLLIFSKKQVVEPHVININELIGGLHKMFLQTIRENIEFILDLTDRPVLVLGDFGQIEQVLMNLVTNARDAMPEGGRLTIGTEIQEIDDKYVEAYGYGRPGIYALIKVGDTGHGMDEETQKKIFEPFFTTKGIGEGTGLGLAISYGIIKQHNGYIKLYSEPGQGTIFKIYLPLVEETTRQYRKAVVDVPVKGGNETILVAEDDASLRKLARIVLEAAGYSVVLAEDGEDAITKFMENRDKIQLAVIDMIMPKKNGKEVAETIRKVSPRTKILFASGYTMDIIKTRELTEAGFDFILKPVEPRELRRKVREALDR